MNDKLTTWQIWKIIIWVVTTVIFIIFVMIITTTDWHYTFSLEMDNNSLEAFKSINWTSLNGIKQVSNYEPIDTSYKIDYNLENKSMPCWKYSNDKIWRCIPQ